MRKSKFSERLISEAVNLVTISGHNVTDVAKGIGVSPQCLYKWVKKHSTTKLSTDKKLISDLQQENMSLKNSLNELRLEVDILKKADAYFASRQM